MPGENDVVLITGGTGHLGFKVLVDTLAAGYHVRAAIRRASSIPELLSHIKIKPYISMLTFIIVPDILARGAYSKALDGATHVLHIASPLAEKYIAPDDYDEELIQPAIRGTLNMLEASAESSSVRRVVITSSIAAIIPWTEYFLEDTEEIFDEKSIIEEPPLGPYLHEFEAYSASKALALAATRDFMRSKRPTFDVINIMPGYIIGRNELVSDLASFTMGTNCVGLRPLLFPKDNRRSPGLSVHLSDVAEVHVRSLDIRAISGGQNFICTSNGRLGTHWNDAIAVARKYFSDAIRQGILSMDGDHPTKRVLVDNSKTAETLGLKFRPFEYQLKEVLEQYVELVRGAARVSPEVMDKTSIGMDEMLGP